MAKKDPFVNVRINYATYQELQIIAANMDVSTTKLVNNLLEQAVNSAKLALDRDEL